MVQMSDKCLLSKTEKAHISGQMQIICVCWDLWLAYLVFCLLGVLSVLYWVFWMVYLVFSSKKCAELYIYSLKAVDSLWRSLYATLWAVAPVWHLPKPLPRPPWWHDMRHGELPGAKKAGVRSWGWCTRSNFDGGGGVSSIPQETCKAGCNLKADNRLTTKIQREICIPSTWFPSTIPSNPFNMLLSWHQLWRELCSSLCPINASINWKQHTKVKHKKKTIHTTISSQLLHSNVSRHPCLIAQT